MKQVKKISKSVWITFLFVALCVFALQMDTGHSQGQPAIARVWEGRTSVAKADAYERYIQEAGLRQLRATAGNLGVQLFRRNNPDNVQFMVISYWESRESIKKIVGQDIQRAMELPRDREFLLEPVTTADHYLVIQSNTAKLGNQ